MNTLNTQEEMAITNSDESTNYADPAPAVGPKYMEGDDNEIVNQEDQNQVVNAQPVEEFVSNYLNKEEPENQSVSSEKVEE